MSSARAASVVDRGDRGLHLVRPDGGGGQRVGDEGESLGGGGPVPEAAVLLGERDEAAVGAGAGRAAGVGQQHERQQAGHLAVVGQQARGPSA